MNKKEIKLLKISYKKENDGKIKERILMLIHSYEGKSSREVGKILQCDQKLVLYWKNRYEKKGLEGLKTKPRSGKPPLLSLRQGNKIKKKIAEDNPANPWTTKKVCDLIKKETGIQYTQRHVQRIKEAVKQLFPLIDEAVSSINIAPSADSPNKLTLKQRMQLILLKELFRSEEHTSELQSR